MPSWPARLHLSTPSPKGSSKFQKDRDSGNQDHVHIGSSPDPPLLDVPVFAPLTPSYHTGFGPKPHHHRSHSHPLTTTTGRKSISIRKDIRVEACGKRSAHANTLATSISKEKSVLADTDFFTGRCATCDSLVRWPRHLDVFRCSMCLMVNDIKPMTTATSILITDGKSATNSRMQSKTLYDHDVSLAKTSDVINECVIAYLRHRLGVDDVLESPYRTRVAHSHVVPIAQGSSQPVSKQKGHPIHSIHQTSSLGLSTSLPAADSHWQEFKAERKTIFYPLEVYLKACLRNVDCLNASFGTRKPPQPLRTASANATVSRDTKIANGDLHDSSTLFSQLDAKTLLIGNFAENRTWWAGEVPAERPTADTRVEGSSNRNDSDRVNARSPRINWAEVTQWYNSVLQAGVDWRLKLSEHGETTAEYVDQILPSVCLSIDHDLSEARSHVHQTLCKAFESLLRRPGRPLKNPEDCRFLLIVLANPLLHMRDSIDLGRRLSSSSPVSSNPYQSSLTTESVSASTHRPEPQSCLATAWSLHTGIIKRVLGLLSMLSRECHQYLVSWFSRFEEPHFRRVLELVGSFVSHRLMKHHSRNRSTSRNPTRDLIPRIVGPSVTTPAQLHAALSLTTTGQAGGHACTARYDTDWQIKAASRIMCLLSAANYNDSTKTIFGINISPENDGPRKKRAHRHGQLVPTDTFYNSMVDHIDLIADFEIWESRNGRFSFCQYPMFLSIWAKIRIMEHDARRQMEVKAREAFFNSIVRRKAVAQYLVLHVRRECLVEDSLRSVSEIVGTGPEEIKKGLRIDFIGEEGLDSGGLRKEWFLLLVREIFDPKIALFLYDEDSRYCYFNPHSFETSDQYFLVGILLGLAIHNSTILDVALPPFAFRKLLADAPNHIGPTTNSSRPSLDYTLDDLAEYRPTLAHGLRQLLEYEGPVEETFCLHFVIDIERYGHTVTVPLCPDGDTKPVTDNNRREFVDAYVRYLLDHSVSRQYAPFKRGFFTVCSGNALSIFRPEEVELLIRGCEDTLDVATLRNVAIYDNWGKGVDINTEPVLLWFWDAVARADSKHQRKLLSFVTASDRIPAMGASSLVFRITCLGDCQNKLPVARTCFNMIALYRYRTKELLEQKLWMAVNESEGFGMR